MRFVKLAVENFRAVTAAELELGPGLNVLYGPNDLGKSTLGVALRAALLLPSNSSAADAYVPWHEPAKPVVSLTFVDDAGKYWRVTKRFTENKATLSFSKDGKEFSVDSHERQVDERLRQLLGWGLAAPGGRTGTKGMPESFLANALLAAQTDVDAILSSSLEGDLEPGGKLKLTAALSALAQDPLVRHVLDAAQREHEQYFTLTGRRKSGQHAPLTQASEAVKRLTDELMAQQQALADSVNTELEAKRLQALWLDAQHAVDTVEQSLKRAQAGLARASEKRAADTRLAMEVKALAGLDALTARATTLDVEVAGLERQVKDHQSLLAAAQQAAKVAATALRDAEDAHRKASSAEGEAERAVARARLKEAQAKHSIDRADLLARLEKAKVARRLAEEIARLTAEQTRLTAQLIPAEAKLKAAQAEAELANGIMNYGHWHTASEAARLAGQWRAEAQQTRTDALRKTTEALAAQTDAKALEDEVSSRRSTLPDEKQRAAFEKLRREADLADAALGGGVTVVVRPRSALLLRSTSDESAPEAAKVEREHVIEADRRVQLAIGDLVDIEVIAGAAEKRKDAEHLRRKWKAEAVPMLERAGVRTMAELHERFAELAETMDRVKVLRANGEKLEQEAGSLRARAAMLEEKAAGAPTAEQVVEKRALVGGLFDVCAPVFASLGPNWEKDARPLHEASTATLAAARAVFAKLQAESTLTGHRLADAREKTEEARRSEDAPTLENATSGQRLADARRKTDDAPTLETARPGHRLDDARGETEDARKPEDAPTLEKALAALDQALAKVATELSALEQERSGAVTQATEKLEQAKGQLAAAEQRLSAATDAVTAARAQASSRAGERDAVTAQVKSMDRPAVLARVEAAKVQLATFVDVEVLSELEFAARERAVAEARAAADQAGRDFAGAERALSMVGGPQARERARELGEAVAVAKAQEHHLEVDAAAWKLLVDAVRESEKEDSSSLGSALAGPVTERFAELTKGRYPAVKFDPSLRATSLEVLGTTSSPEGILAALSVGTRDHLATLVRLAIALQLKSAIVLDDHLVHTDLGRLEWFREALRTTAQKTQVLVLTCRPLDYVPEGALPTGKAVFKDVDATRVINLEKVILRR